MGEPTTCLVMPVPSDKTPILIIDDDEKLCWLIKDYLEPLGYAVSMAHDGERGLQLAASTTFAAVLLDVMMPGPDGFAVLRRLRQVNRVPVLMLTARGEEPDRIHGLDLGADDYLPKTCSSRELLARLRAVIRRSSQGPETSGRPEGRWTVGRLQLDEGTRSAAVDGRPLELTAVEFALLACLIRAEGCVCSREALMQEAASRDFEDDDRSIDVHISALRRKLGDDAKSPRYIRTVRGLGYQLAAKAIEEEPK